MGGGGSKGKKQPASKKKVNEHDRAILELKVQRDKLKQYSKKIEQSMEHETELAKQQLAAGKRDRAMLCLKKKKYQQGLLDKAEAQLENIQKMVDSIEFAQMEVKVFENLKEGSEVLKQIQSQISVEEIDEIMLDTEEAMEKQREIDEALSMGLASMDIDEDDILAEYEALEALEAGAMDLPDAPTHALPSTVKTPTKTPTKTPAKREAALA